MYQYALYMKLVSMGREVKFDDINEYRDEKTRPIMLSVFDVTYPRATWDEINRYTDGSTHLKDRIRKRFRGKKTNIYKEQGFYDPEVLNKEDVYLDGTFQSQKYFEDILDDVKKVFSFGPLEDLHLSPSVYEETKNWLTKIQSVNAVGIHLRRSDSRQDEGRYAGICTPEYYEGAIRYILEREKDAVFFIFSNEPKWVKTIVRDLVRRLIDESWSREEVKEFQNRFVLVQANSDITSYLDLILYSNCRNYIISNSSFSWWGSWMCDKADKMIIAPTPWTNDATDEAMYTEGMILINGKGRVDHRVKGI